MKNLVKIETWRLLFIVVSLRVFDPSSEMTIMRFLEPSQRARPPHPRRAHCRLSAQLASNAHVIAHQAAARRASAHLIAQVVVASAPIVKYTTSG